MQAWFPGDDLLAPAARRRGLPIGNLTSQWLANLYLEPLGKRGQRPLTVAGVGKQEFFRGGGGVSLSQIAVSVPPSLRPSVFLLDSNVRGYTVFVRKRGVIPMGRLFAKIRTLVGDEKYVVGEHAVERLDERGILEWQIIAGFKDARLIVERPRAKPNPVVEVLEVLPDGTEVKAVWSDLVHSGVAKLITVHFFDEGAT